MRKWEKQIAISATILVLVLLLFVSIEPREVCGQETGESVIVVPIKVNVLKGVDITDEEIDEIIKAMNEILKQAGIRGEFDKAKNINRDVSDEGNNNGKIEKTEDEKLDKKCVEELEKKFGKGKGIKFVITNEIHEDPGITGCSPACSPESPVIYLKKRPPTDPAERKGRTAAHEVAHVCSLGSGHAIEDKNHDGDTDDPDESADADGHATAPTDKGNLMSPYTEDGGTKLTPTQIDEIKKGAEKRGKTKILGAPVKSKETRHCSWTDDSNDVSQRYVDLSLGSLFAEGPAAALQIAIQLSGFHPIAVSVISSFGICFNTDNNASTGQTISSFSGVDKVLRINLTGEYPFSVAGQIESSLYTVETGLSEPLELGSIKRIAKIFDMEWPEIPWSFIYADSIRQSIALPLLGTLADQVPIGIRSTDLQTGEFDEASFVFDFAPSPGPSFSLLPSVAAPGEWIELLGAGFSPLSQLDILVDDTGILSTTALADGTFTTGFSVPALFPDFYFITARDTTGAFDFSVLTVTGVAISDVSISKNVTSESVTYLAATVLNRLAEPTTLIISACAYAAHDSRQIGECYVDSIAPGESVIVTCRWDTTPALVEKYTIHLVVHFTIPLPDLEYVDGVVSRVPRGEIIPDGTINIKDIASAAKAFLSSTPKEDINDDGLVDEIDAAIVKWAINAYPPNLDADLNHDGVVDVLDAIAVAGAFGHHAHERWNQNADVNSDNAINIVDLAAVALKFGYSYPWS